MAYEPTNTWESADFKSLTDFIKTKSTEMDKLVSDAGGIHALKAEQVEEFQARNDELGKATKRWEDLREMDSGFQRTKEFLRRMSQPGGQMIHQPQDGDEAGDHARAIKSLGELLTEAEEYKSFAGRGHSSQDQYKVELPDVDVKATITTSAGFAQEAVRGPRIVESAQRRPVVADLIPQTTTRQLTVRYMEETTFTNNAAPVSENSAKPESALAWTERSQNVEVVATYVPITDQQLDDVPQLRGLVDNRLTLMLQLAEESQLLNGNGSAPQLMGFYNKSGVQTQAKGTDPVPDAIYKAFTKVRFTGFAEPTGVVLHPNDWQDVRLLRTTDGIYIWGSPSEAGPERIWGKQVIVTPAATENTGLTGDFQLYSEIVRRMGITILVGFINDDFIKNKRTIRAEERLALLIYRAAAFCTITGI